MPIFLLSLLLLFSCSNKKNFEEGESNMCTQSIVYGQNDLTNVNEAASSMQEVSASVAGMVQRSRIMKDMKAGSATGDPINNRYRVYTSPIEHFAKSRNSLPMCQNQISNLGAAVNCTGFLVGKDLLLTAGHCLSKSNRIESTTYKCRTYEWIFGLEKEESFRDYDGLYIRDENRFKCREVIAFQNSGTSDYALIRLDREVSGRRALKLTSSANLKLNDPIYTIGFPYGSPMKVTPNGKYVSSVSSSDFFNTKIDTFPSFSGAPILNQRTNEVVGIHVNGLTNPLEDVGGCMDFSRRCENENDCGESQAQSIEKIQSLSGRFQTSSLSNDSSCN